jgi:hypothetical protein
LALGGKTWKMPADGVKKKSRNYIEVWAGMKVFFIQHIVYLAHPPLSLPDCRRR